MPRGLIICFVNSISFCVILSGIMSDWCNRKFSHLSGAVLFLLHHFLPVKEKALKKAAQGVWPDAVCSGKASDSWVPSSWFIPVETSFSCVFVASRCTRAVSGGTMALQDRGYIYFCFVQLQATIVSKQQDSNSFSSMSGLIWFLLAYFKNCLTIVWLYLPEIVSSYIHSSNSLNIYLS